jgi:DNA-directed RNA polymerase specialized sigma24 family protein
MGAPNSGSIPLNDRSLEAERSAPATLSERVQALFQQFRVPVFRYLLRKTRNPGTAEDLTQETFLRLCRHLRDERPLDNAKAWLLTVANNLAIDEVRSDRNQTDLYESAWREIEESRSDAEADPEEVLFCASDFFFKTDLPTFIALLCKDLFVIPRIANLATTY